MEKTYDFVIKHLKKWRPGNHGEHIFFLEIEIVTTKIVNSKSLKKSVVSFCRRRTSLKHVLALYAWVRSKQQSSQNTHHHIAELNASWKNHYSSNIPHPYCKMKPLSNRSQKKWEKLYVKLSSRGQLNRKISFSWDQLKNWIHSGFIEM